MFADEFSYKKGFVKVMFDISLSKEDYYKWHEVAVSSVV